jgi:bacterial/archaeal transporter family-2 protein
VSSQSFFISKKIFMQSRFFLVVMALVSGAILPVQATINFRMSKQVGGPIVSAFVSFAVGTIGLLIYLVASKQFNFREIIAQPSPWWIWIGGLLGAVYVSSVVVLVPKLGVALAFSLIIAGQMIMAIIFDHFGWLGLAIKEISPGKIIGVLLLVAGVVLIRKF